MIIDDSAKKLEILPCPFCGGEAKLEKCSHGLRQASWNQIVDGWKVKCKNGCCESKAFEDCIYHSTTGEIVVEKNGAYDAIECWNQRK